MKRLLETEYDYKQDLTDLYADQEKVTLKFSFGVIFNGYRKVSGDICRER